MIGTNQVVEIVLGDTPQEEGLVERMVGFYEYVEVVQRFGILLVN